MPVDWLKALGGLAGAGRGYENAKFGRQQQGAPGAASGGGGGGGGLLAALAARRQQPQQPPPGFTPYSQGRPFNQPAPPIMGAAPPPVSQGGLPPGLMNPVPGGSAVPGVPNLPMQGPPPPAMAPPGMGAPGMGGPPPGMGGGPPPGAGGPPPGPPAPPTNLYRQAQGGDDNDNTDNPDLRMANGGIVDKPTTALLGEDGPEMVVPLNRRPGNRVSPANLPGRRPMPPPPGPPGAGMPGVGAARPPMISPAMRYRSRLR